MAEANIITGMITDSVTIVPVLCFSESFPKVGKYVILSLNQPNLLKTLLLPPHFASSPT